MKYFTQAATVLAFLIGTPGITLLVEEQNGITLWLEESKQEIPALTLRWFYPEQSTLKTYEPEDFILSNQDNSVSDLTAWFLEQQEMIFLERDQRCGLLGESNQEKSSINDHTKINLIISGDFTTVSLSELLPLLIKTPPPVAAINTDPIRVCKEDRTLQPQESRIEFDLQPIINSLKNPKEYQIFWEQMIIKELIINQISQWCQKIWQDYEHAPPRCIPQMGIIHSDARITPFVVLGLITQMTETQETGIEKNTILRAKQIWQKALLQQQKSLGRKEIAQGYQTLLGCCKEPPPLKDFMKNSLEALAHIETVKVQKRATQWLIPENIRLTVHYSPFFQGSCILVEEIEQFLMALNRFYHPAPIAPKKQLVSLFPEIIEPTPTEKFAPLLP